MSSSDLFIDGFPHGTPKGYEDGCRGGACPAGVEHGLSCKTAWNKSHGDYRYQQLAKQNLTPAEIAADLFGRTPEAPTPSPADIAPKPPIAKLPKFAKGGVIKVTPADIAKAFDVEPVVEPQEPETPAAPLTTIAPTPREIRAWAHSKGYDVGVKGKIPQHIVDHYWEATGLLSLADTTKAIDTADPARTYDELPELARKIAEFGHTPTDETFPIEKPGERPEWSTVTLHQDLEAARNLAARLEQELARSEEQRDTDRAQHAESLRIAVRDYDGLMDDLETTARTLLASQAAQTTAERSLEFALTKWDQQRAANEASYKVILQQAHTINTLLDRQDRIQRLTVADVEALRGQLDTAPSTPATAPTTARGWFSRRAS